MLPEPHGGTLVQQRLAREAADALVASGLPRVAIPRERAQDVFNVAVGLYSPLRGFMSRDELDAVVRTMRLPGGVPWTIPILLDLSEEDAARAGDAALLEYEGRPVALLETSEIFEYDRERLAEHVYGTTSADHPGVAMTRRRRARFAAGRVSLLADLDLGVSRYTLGPRDTRVLFAQKGWKSVVGFQTRNVPHLGHEHVQKAALTFADGLFVNPVIGEKKPGDFRDEVILASYEALLAEYFPRQRAVLAVLHTEMRYAGPREAIFHAIVRKNFGCTHFIVGRDHAGVGSFYHPYAAHAIFDQFPDLGVEPLFFTAFFHCRKCGEVVNEKTCPHGPEHRTTFSGTGFRKALSGRAESASDLVRPEVAAAVAAFPEPFV